MESIDRYLGDIDSAIFFSGINGISFSMQVIQVTAFLPIDQHGVMQPANKKEAKKVRNYYHHAGTGYAHEFCKKPDG